MKISYIYDNTLQRFSQNEKYFWQTCRKKNQNIRILYSI